MLRTNTAVDGRHLRRDRNRAAAAQALLDLYREGDLSPTVEEVAQRAGLSARSVYRYFEDLDGLVETVIGRQQQYLRPLWALPVEASMPLAGRINAFVAARVRLLEAMGDVGLVARAVAPNQPRVATELQRIRRGLSEQVMEVFEAELVALPKSEGDAVRAALDVAGSWETHHLLRTDQGLSRPAATRAMRVAFSRILVENR